MRAFSRMMPALLLSISLPHLAEAQNPGDPNPYDHSSVDPTGQTIIPGWTLWDSAVKDNHRRFFYSCIMEGRSERAVSQGAECRERPAGLPAVPAGFRFEVVGVAAGEIPSWPALERIATPDAGHPTAPCPATNLGCQYARAILDFRNYCYEVGYRDLDTAHCPNDYGDLNESLCGSMTGVTEGHVCSHYVTGGGIMSTLGGIYDFVVSGWNRLNAPAARAPSTRATGSTADSGEARDPRPRRIAPDVHTPPTAREHDGTGDGAGAREE